MNANTLLKTTAVVAVLTGTNLAQAGNNPLEPNFYANKFGTAAPVIEQGTTQAYVDSNNPLSPSLGRIGQSAWVQTSNISATSYIDSTNPLHPSFKRN